MDGPEQVDAATEALAFLQQYSPRKPPRYAAPPSTDFINSSQRLIEALADAHTVLTVTAESAISRQSESLRRVYRRQFAINLAHFITGSGFVALLSSSAPEAVKWAGAAVSLLAGIVALTLPKDVGPLQKELISITSTTSALTGEIAELQLDLQERKTSPEVYRRAKKAIANCAKLAQKYELDKTMQLVGYNVYNLLDKEALKKLDSYHY